MKYQDAYLHRKYTEAREAGVDIEWKDVEDYIDALYQQWPGMQGIDAIIEAHMWIESQLAIARHRQHARTLKNEQS